MQAMIIFVIYGFFFAVVNSLMQTGSLAAIERKEMHIVGVEEYFEKVAKAYQTIVLLEHGRAPDFGEGVEDYFNYNLLKTSVNWYFSPDHDTDPWGRPFEGYVLHKRVPVAAQPSGNATVYLPVAGFVFVSSGPDRQLDPDLQLALNGLSSSSELRDVARLSATEGSDDIVYTFSIYGEMLDDWGKVVEGTRAIAQDILRQYLAMKRNFAQALEAQYGLNYTNFYENGVLIDSPANRSTWASDGVRAPIPDLNQFRDGSDVGIYEAVQYIEEEKELRVRIKAYRSSTGIGSGINNQRCNNANQTNADTIRVCITNNGSSWGQASGDLFYYKDVVVEE